VGRLARNNTIANSLSTTRPRAEDLETMKVNDLKTILLSLVRF
jgi:hypothetical protein